LAVTVLEARERVGGRLGTLNKVRRLVVWRLRQR